MRIIVASLLVVYFAVMGAMATTSKPLQMMVAMPFKLNPIWENPFQLDRALVEPVITLAIQDVKKRGLLNNTSIELHFKNTNCSDTLGPYYAVEAYCAKQLDVILGFANAYALAPVARLSGYWNQGVPLLTRMNGSYRYLGSTVIQLLALFNYKRVGFLYHNNQRRPTFGKSECYFQIYAIYNQLIKTAGWHTLPSVDFDQFFMTLSNYEELLKKVSMTANGKCVSIQSCSLRKRENCVKSDELF
ncbi:unnamed protein product [Soboliphyme baturini]|uniref:ANF_receptor domain-containing protein n=1 Tax=Soboliphyme baturini TaxID=241478 RepID=A0A183IMV6_9BILA|nr:unnamed protein product [Soboliphyme baturini]